jgi:hypothetical protein
MPVEIREFENRPPEGEIPDILEWKLDVIMAQLAKMGGGTPAEHDPKVGGTRERLPDPQKFDPAKDSFPDYPGIPKVLEWKLDVIMVQLAKAGLAINIFLPGINILFMPLILVLVPGLGAIVALLAIIAGLLTGIQALLLFLVVQIAVPFIIARNRKKVKQLLGTP